MAEAAKVTPGAEAIATNVEGTVEAEIAKVAPEQKAEPATETVPLSVYLSLKDDVKELRKEIKEAKNSEKSTVVLDGVEDLAKKYPDVSKDFINDILSSATSKAQKEIDSKYSPIIEKVEQEKKLETFNKAFDKVYDKALSDNPDLPANIDKEAIKTLSLTPAYKNTPISEILLKLYGTVEKGKETTENNMRTAGDSGEQVINFDKMTVEQRARVMDDPEARKKYFAYLDTK